MSISHLLEDFGGSSETIAESAPASQIGEEALLESFEKGYRAGWDDADKAHSEGSRVVSETLAANLQDLSFTYHEAREAILSDVAPMVEQAVMTVLPEIARNSVGALVIGELRRIVDSNTKTPVRLTTSETDHPVIESMLPDDLQFPVEILANPTLLPGQVQFEFDQREREIDLSEVLATVEQAFAAFTHETRKEAQNG